MSKGWFGRSGSIAVAVGLVVALVMVSTARAEEEKKKELEVGRWYPELVSGINLTQSSFSDNWAGGDKGSLVWTFITNGALENQFSKKVNWKNTLKLAYGQSHSQKADTSGTRHWESPSKSTDLIEFETVLRLTLGSWLDPFASVRFDSQFQDASDPAGRTLALNPLRFRESAGLARQFINQKDHALQSRLGFSLRQSSRRTFQESVPSKKTTSETTNDGGLEWVTNYKNTLAEGRISWTSQLIGYRPFFYTGKSDLDGYLGRTSAADLAALHLNRDTAKYTTAMDWDWENIFSSQVTKILSVSLYTKWIYDKYDNSVKPTLGSEGNLSNPAAVRSAVRPAGQFKQTLSLGVTYRFI
jgi:hypothetical protein